MAPADAAGIAAVDVGRTDGPDGTKHVRLCFRVGFVSTEVVLPPKAAEAIAQKMLSEASLCESGLIMPGDAIVKPS